MKVYMKTDTTLSHWTDTNGTLDIAMHTHGVNQTCSQPIERWVK